MKLPYSNDTIAFIFTNSATADCSKPDQSMQKIFDTIQQVTDYMKRVLLLLQVLHKTR